MTIKTVSDSECLLCSGSHATNRGGNEWERMLGRWRHTTTHLHISGDRWS